MFQMHRGCCQSVSTAQNVQGRDPVQQLSGILLTYILPCRSKIQHRYDCFAFLRFIRYSIFLLREVAHMEVIN